uniref:Inositol-pentakisphosphate 2-kinase (Ins(1,3,4,5,6)P5 2-kinase) (InsP5 2-kinase)) n=1 Tax=Ganoderma boninense TaxID=34458 RepID=A0A5K1K2R2_9APHY|nr:Inositol-pentakisphosphate 2-kinase (EC (Inositol-1,3,4,5,6-pentakisphosphate 2-kinase) (Ins(1,3,4,5,6)P5 2-kinase) (InsP5 2-kinase) [Ganoderma boninense]
MEDYLFKRQNLIIEDRAKRVDRNTTHKLSHEESRADDLLKRIRKEEGETIWGKEQLHDSEQLFPGMEFLTGKSLVDPLPLYNLAQSRATMPARDTILRTKVYDILSHMPKGGLLHLHLGMVVRADKLLKLGLQYPAMHVRVSAPLTTETLGTVQPTFRALPPELWTAHPSLTDALYVPGSWVPLQSARNNFSKALGGPAGFDRWVTDWMVINPSEAYGTHNSPDKIWSKFGAASSVSAGMIFYFPLWIEYVREVFLSSVEDGISYVEPRFMFGIKHMTGEDGKEDVPHRAWLRAYEQVIAEVKASVAARPDGGTTSKFLGSKIIYSREFPHLVAGFDLVGHEDLLRPLIYYAEPFLRSLAKQRECGVQFPFVFHAGETLGDGSAADMNLYDAILLGTKRIGHGFSLIKHPRLMELCKERKICVEVCPISNEILRYCGSMPMHPLPALMNQGVHVALCSDDPAVFGNMGLSFDFFQASAYMLFSDSADLISNDS